MPEPQTFAITTAVSLVLLVLSTVLGIFHTVMQTTRLDVRQWVICSAVALSIVVVAEIRKAVRRPEHAQRLVAPHPGPDLPCPPEGLPDRSEDPLANTSVPPGAAFRAGHQAKQLPILPAMLLARVLPERL